MALMLMLGFILAGSMTACGHLQSTDRLQPPGLTPPTSLGVEMEGDQQIRITLIAGKVFYSFPDVTGLTFFSQYLLDHTTIRDGESVLDLGTGSGIQAIFAAEKASHVLATDIDEQALKSTLRNAREHHVADKISVRNSDVFNAIRADEKFDVIIASLPIASDVQSEFSWTLYKRFFAAAGSHLNPHGRIYFLSGFLDNLPRMRDLVVRNKLQIMQLHMDFAPLQDLEPMVYVIQHRVEPEKTAEDDSHPVTTDQGNH